MNLTISHTGDFKNTLKYLKSAKKTITMKDIENFIDVCVTRLQAATPIRTGVTADSWKYSIQRDKNNVYVNIDNTNIQNGINIAILIDSGHATRDGSFIPGLNFITPIVNETYKEIINKTWKELRSL